MQVVNFNSQEDVNAWVDSAREYAQKAYEWQQDWKATKKQVQDLIVNRFPQWFDDECFVSWVEFTCTSNGAVSSEVRLFRVWVYVYAYEGDQQIGKDWFDIPCSKSVLTDEESREKFLEQVEKRLNELF